MPIDAPLSPADFYESLPSPDHRTGDIWRDLPTFGNLNRTTATGIVITPACDLAQRKCEAVTYLPVISVDEYLGSSAFRFECWTEVQPLLARIAGFEQMATPARYDLPDWRILETLSKAERDTQGKMLSEAERQRVRSYADYVKAALQRAANVVHVRSFYKRDRLSTHITRLITNALKPDVHFLPKDGKPASYSAVPEHSVVLFRCPLTIPVAVLTSAQSLIESQWGEYCRTQGAEHGVLSHMPKWPIKLAALRGEFLSDMITRYVNMYIRLGSSDFTEQAVQDMAAQIEGAQ